MVAANATKAAARLILMPFLRDRLLLDRANQS
jgi:hypothetical protein